MTVMRRLSLASLAFASLLPAATVYAEDVRAAVNAGNRAFVVAFLKGDSKAVSELYTGHAQVIAPGAAVAKGRAAIADFWQKAIDSGIKDVKLETADVESSGDLAIETGTVTLTAKDGSTSSDRYVVAWKKADGRWLLHRDIWNSAK